MNEFRLTIVPLPVHRSLHLLFKEVLKVHHAVLLVAAPASHTKQLKRANSAKRVYPYKTHAKANVITDTRF